MGDCGFSAGPFQYLQHEDAPNPIIHENEAMNGHILAQIRAHTAVHPPFSLILEAIDPQLTGSLEPGTPAWHIGFGITAFEFPRALSRNTETLPQVHGDALFLDRQAFHVLEIMWAIRAVRFSQHHQPHLLFLRYFLRTADFR